MNRVNKIIANIVIEWWTHTSTVEEEEDHVYVDHPALPGDTIDTTIPTTDGFVLNSDGPIVGVPEDHNKDRLQLRALSTVEKIIGINNPTVGNGSTSNFPLYEYDTGGANPDNYEVHGITIDGNDANGVSAIQLQESGEANGHAGIKYSNVDCINVDFAAVFGNLNSTSRRYGTHTFEWMRMWQENPNADGGEVFYLNKTDSKSSANLSWYSMTILQNFAKGFGREAIQFTDMRSFLVDQCTFIHTQHAPLVGQDRSVQVHNTEVSGIIQNSIFMGNRSCIELFTHGVTFKNCYFSWTTDIQQVINQLEGSGFAPNEHLTNTKIRFENCIFDPTVAQTDAVFDIKEDNCDVEFVNCLLGSNCNGLYDDNRTDTGTYSISNTGEGVYSGGVPTFTFTAQADRGEATFGQLTNTTLLATGMGYRTQAVA